MSEIRKVTVLGTGVLGAQIAFQTAYNGFEVSAYDINEQAIEAARQRMAGLVTSYKADFPEAPDGKAEDTLNRLSYFTDLAEAVADADLVIEAVPEVLEIKRDLYTRLSKVAPAKTIFATNSSTLLPSAIKDFTGRPGKFLALHFANLIWKHNVVEVMGTTETDASVIETCMTFAPKIGMVPVAIHKEKAGYIMNTLSVPFLRAALELVVDGYAEPADVDKVWRISNGVPYGPFQVLDIVGMNTPYNVFGHSDEKGRLIADWIKQNYIDKGKLGLSSGEGFYTYP